MSTLQLGDNEPPAPEDSTTTKSLGIQIPDARDPADSDGMRAENEPERSLHEEGDSFAGLSLERIRNGWEGKGPPMSEDEDQGGKPNIDIVYIVGVVTSQHIVLDLPLISSSRLPAGSKSRDLRFFVNVQSLLNDDFDLTRRSVDAEAHRLLAGLKHFQHSDVELSRSAIIFVVHDVGAIILQKAISIASSECTGEPGIFTDTARIFFCGSFLRAENEEQMGVKMFKFLDDGSDDGRLPQHATLSAAKNLAVISLYAGPNGNQIPSIFDYSTATIGIASELAVQEELPDENGRIFPKLDDDLCFPEIHGWADDRWQAALESTFMSLIPEDVQMLSKSQSQDHRVFSSTAYHNWKSQTGAQILYISGPDVQANTETAEQIGLRWVRESCLERPGNVFAFLFDSHDPLRNSISPMLTALLFHFLLKGNSVSDHINTWSGVFRDHYELQNAWLEQDILNLVTLTDPRVMQDTPIFLLNLDECNARSRETFWELLGQTVSKREEPAKFVVTSSKPANLEWSRVLREELKRWPEIKLLEYSSSSDLADSEMLDLPEDDLDTHHTKLISRLCPKGIAEFEIHENLVRLRPMDRATLDTILHLLETYSQWPSMPSSANLAVFCSFLKDVSPTSTPGYVRDSILQSIPNQERLRWLLSWIRFGQRPLTSSELSMLLCYCTSMSGNFSAVSDEDIQRSLTETLCQLRGFADLQEDKIRISRAALEIWEVLQGGMWTTVQQTAPETTATFLLDFLGSEQVQGKLVDLYENYQGIVERSQKGLAPPLRSNGRDAIFYAVQALPYHLSLITVPHKTRQAMCDPNGRYMAWSKVYWAMSNPLARPASGPLTSAWTTWESSPEFGPLNLVRARFNDELEQGSLEDDKDEYEEAEMLINKLIAAVKANNEELAMVFAEKVLADLESDSSTTEVNTLPKPSSLALSSAVLRPMDGSSAITIEHNGSDLPEDNEHLQCRWPASILWRATWLGMNRLLELLLKHGLREEDDRLSVFNPSLLFLACRMGNFETVNTLIRVGSDVRIKSHDTEPLGVLCEVAKRGNLDIAQALLEKDRSMLEHPEPVSPLYSAACWGSWEIARLLITFGANPNKFMTETPVPAVDNDGQEDANVEEGWTPLAAACAFAYLETARVLLQNGANPDKAALNDSRLPLDLAAVDTGSVEMVRLLLMYNADPNHALLDPPILTAMIERAQVSDETKISIFNLLLENRPAVQVDKPDKDGQTALIAAAKKDDMVAIRWLLEHGANINAVDQHNKHALFWAVQCRNKVAVEALLEHREKPHLDLESNGPLELTLLQTALGDIGLFQTLVDAGADLTFENLSQQTILNSAVAEANIEALEFLLSLGPEKHVDIHHSDDMSYTPILQATGFWPSVEIARILMDHDARLSDVTSGGNSPLHLVAMNRQPAILRVLLEYSTAADLERRDNNGNTPLLAGTQGYGVADTFDCIKLLVRAGANVNAQNLIGETSLMRAATLRGEAAVIPVYLLSRPDIDVQLATIWGMTALHTASHHGMATLVSKLLKHGADPNARALTCCSTPLIAACLPLQWMNGTETAVDDAERIVRDLVSHGANSNAMTGLSIYSPLCAASLGAGVGTIHYLLDKSASAQRADPLGRFPIHFAAANGIRNFEAVALAHGDDIMVADRFKNNVLHWAAKFGHVETVRAILERLTPKDQKIYINAGDEDGWTPLAWACRPTRWCMPFWHTSEREDYTATIQCLLDHEADKSARFRIGPVEDEESVEEFTPLKMAKRCEFGDDILRMLEIERKESSDGEGVSRDEIENVTLVDEISYRKTQKICHFCFSHIWGLLWTCQSCEPGEYNLCSKCYRRGRVEHRKSIFVNSEEEDHWFETTDATYYSVLEIEDPPSIVPSVKAPSPAGDANRQDTPVVPQEDEEATPGSIAYYGQYSDIADFDFSDLNA